MARHWDNLWGQHWYFPTDLYFMDLDGTWLDFVVPPIGMPGVFDIDQGEHTNGSGDWEPEIWLARISPYSMGMPGINYTQELIDYFDRNHDYRTGVISRPNKACLYIDDDWSSYANEWISNFTAYTGSSLDAHYTNALTTSTDYMQRMNTYDFEFVHLLVHSWPTYHTFGPAGNGADGTTSYKDVWGNDTLPFFLNLYACYSANFTQKNNTGTYYLFSNDTLVVIGSSRSGGMDLYQPFYDNLSLNMTIGKSFSNWFYNPEIEKLNKTELYYGMTIFGDPLLTIYMNDADSITVTKPMAPDTWINGTQYNITWNYMNFTGGVSNSVDIALYNSSGWVQNITLNIPNNGSFTWTVPNNLSDGTDYYINISDSSDQDPFGNSANFEINNFQPPPDSITITSPISTSTWYKDSTYEITWTWTGGFANVDITLWIGLVFNLTIAGGANNNGSFFWTVPDNLTDGSYYSIKIEDMSGIITDVSANFTIQEEPTNQGPGGGGPSGIPGAGILLIGGVSILVIVFLTKSINKKRKIAYN
jgi:hypothetical protein